MEGQCKEIYDVEG